MIRAQKSKMGRMDQKWNLINYSEPEIYARLKKKKLNYSHIKYLKT